MSLAKLARIEAKRVMGIDASTNSFAYCIFDGENVEEYGEIYITGDTVYARIVDAKKKIRALKSRFSVDFIAIEAAVMVRSANTGLKMAYIFGAIMGELIESGNQIIEVHPITWQSYIGNTNFTKAQKDAVKKSNPGRSDNWLKAEIRKQRKQKTMDFMAKLGVHTDSDNVSDAAGIAWYALNNLAR